MKQLLASLLLLTALACSAHASDRPNIIVILVDEMGYSDLGAYGGEVDTPSIDALAEGGLRFTQNYNSARCCPSRASLLTGLYSQQAGIADFTGPDRSASKGPAYRGKLTKQCVTLAEVLKTVGYSTYGVGKWHVGREESPVTRGFDEYYGYIHFHSQPQWEPRTCQRLPEDRTPELTHEKGSFYATDAFSDYAVEFIKQGAAKKKPFFLYLAHSSPHFLCMPQLRRATSIWIDTAKAGMCYERNAISVKSRPDWPRTAGGSPSAPRFRKTARGNLAKSQTDIPACRIRRGIRWTRIDGKTSCIAWRLSRR